MEFNWGVAYRELQLIRQSLQSIAKTLHEMHDLVKEEFGGEEVEDELQK